MVEKVQKALQSLKLFKDAYQDHRAKLKDYFKEGEPKEWEFAPQLVFHRYDKFMERVETINVSRPQMLDIKLFPSGQYYCRGH